MKFGNITGGAGKKLITSTNLPAKDKGKIAHVKQKDKSPSVDEDFTKHSGRTNQVPGRKVNDVLSKKQDSTVANAKRTLVSSGQSSTKGFVTARGREFKGYK